MNNKSKLAKVDQSKKLPINQKAKKDVKKACKKPEQQKQTVPLKIQKAEPIQKSKIKSLPQQKIPEINKIIEPQAEESFQTIDTLDQKEEIESIKEEFKEEKQIIKEEYKEKKQIINKEEKQIIKDEFKEEKKFEMNPLVSQDPEAKRVFQMIEETKNTCNSTLERVSKTLEDLQKTRQNITEVDQKMQQFMDNYAIALNSITDNLAISLQNQNLASLPYENDTKEYFDSTEEFSQKINEFADLIKTSKNIMLFTGAGISTFSGIPDYRSTKETILPTGPGVHTKDKSSQKSNEFKPNLLPKPSITYYSKLIKITIYRHMAIKVLQERNIIQTVVSQNIDGLHLKSGIPLDKLMELHGNLQVQYCNKCGYKFCKDQKIKFNFPQNHKCGKKCYLKECNGELLDNIINFGEALDKQCIEKAIACAKNSDLFSFNLNIKLFRCIALGSSLGVSPANSLVQMVKNNGKVVIANLQKTQLDYTADIRFFAYCDEVMKALLKKLNIPLPSFEQKMTIQVIKQNKELLINQLNQNNEEIHYIQSITIKNLETKKELTLEQRPYQFQISNEKKLNLILVLDSEYAPQNISFNMILNEIKLDEPYLINFIYDESKKQWRQIK